MLAIQEITKISADINSGGRAALDRILVPIDFSQAALVALDYAVAIAKEIGASITIYHSFTPMANISLAAGNIPLEQEIDKLITQLTQQAEDLIKPYKAISYREKEGFVEIDTLIKVGYVSDDIAMLTEETYNLVVLGTKGVSGIDEVIFGSVAGKVAEVAKCPVLIVPEKAFFNGIESIVYATELGKSDQFVIDDLLDFAEIFEAKISCLHINTEANNMAEKLTKLTDLESCYWFTPIKKLTFELVTGESVLKSLYQYLDEHKPDMITVVHKNRSFIEGIFHQSISKKLAFHSKIPVLVLQE
jgi:nucleotide-binding universal stress UspA family protein